MKKSLIFGALTAAALFANTASAADFFDTSEPESLMNLGLRFGINTTNRNLNKNVFDVWNCNSWGTGIDAGVVADINFRDWISVQPGLFYESRSGKFNYINTAGYDADGDRLLLTQYGRDRSYNFIIPVMACVHFNVSDDIRWNVEFGPYLQITLKNSVNGEFQVPNATAPENLPTEYRQVNSTKCDFGLKMGSSLKILDHYLVGVHYEAGLLKPWQDGSLGGRRKGWVFSIGYDF